MKLKFVRARLRARMMLLAGVAVGFTLLFITTAHMAAAQTPTPLQPGDVVWTFAPDPLFSDDRIAAALGALMAGDLQAAAPAGTSIVRVTPRGPGFEPGFVAQAGDVPVLFRAAGFPDPSVLREIGQCKVWAAPPPVGTSPTTPPAAFEARPRLIDALGSALGSVGIRARSCVATDNIAEAHVVIWQHGGAAPTLTQRNEPTFLWWQGDVGTVAPRQPGGTGGGPPAPRPGATGNAGLRVEPKSAPPAAMLLATVVLVGAARLVVQRGRRSTRV